MAMLTGSEGMVKEDWTLDSIEGSIDHFCMDLGDVANRTAHLVERVCGGGLPDGKKAGTLPANGFVVAMGDQIDALRDKIQMIKNDLTRLETTCSVQSPTVGVGPPTEATP